MVRKLKIIISKMVHIGLTDHPLHARLVHSVKISKPFVSDNGFEIQIDT